MVAVGIAAGVLWLLRVLAADPTATDAVQGLYPILGLWWVIDLLWAMGCSLAPRTQPAPSCDVDADPPDCPGLGHGRAVSRGEVGRGRGR